MPKWNDMKDVPGIIIYHDIKLVPHKTWAVTELKTLPGCDYNVSISGMTWRTQHYGPVYWKKRQEFSMQQSIIPMWSTAAIPKIPENRSGKSCQHLYVTRTNTSIWSQNFHHFPKRIPPTDNKNRPKNAFCVQNLVLGERLFSDIQIVR